MLNDEGWAAPLEAICVIILPTQKAKVTGGEIFVVFFSHLKDKFELCKKARKCAAGTIVYSIRGGKSKSKKVAEAGR
jgi:hypothetical protein